jgi:putative transposase
VGVPVSRKRVARLMRWRACWCVSRRKWVIIMQRDPAEPPAPDLVERAFVAPGPSTLARS